MREASYKDKLEGGERGRVEQRRVSEFGPG